MKRLLFSILILAGISGGVLAQENFYWGFRGGMNLSHTVQKADMGADLDYKSKPGFRVGMVVGTGIVKNLSLETGLYFTTLGMKNKLITDEVKFSINYIQLPIQFAFRPDLGKKLRLHVGMGPYVACGVGGKIENRSENIDVYGEEDYFKRFDVGMSVSGGLCIGKFFVGLGYDWGLVDIFTNQFKADIGVIGGGSSEGRRLHNRNFWVGIGINL
ncbi:MAG: PorT family protein [Odoribacter sp.]|nr:PorT family protein [Odoribacter sp.]